MCEARCLYIAHNFYREEKSLSLSRENFLKENQRNTNVGRKIKAENQHTEAKCSFSWETRTRQSVFQMPTNIFMPVRFWIAFKNVQMCWEIFLLTFSFSSIRRNKNGKMMMMTSSLRKSESEKRNNWRDEKKSIFNLESRKDYVLVKSCKNWEILWINFLCKFLWWSRKKKRKKKVKNWI
jgi:competence CoiA-like predicted nuclease